MIPSQILGDESTWDLLPDILLIAECLIGCDGHKWWIIHIRPVQNIQAFGFNRKDPDLFDVIIVVPATQN